MVCTLNGYYNARPKMCFSPTPPPSIPKTIFSSDLTFGNKCISDHFSIYNINYHRQDYSAIEGIVIKEQDTMQRPEEIKIVKDIKIDEETTSDYKQWLHAMKLVARLPGGIPPEFRRKLWLSLADKYLKSKNINWVREEEKCFCEKWREDDEELGIQIVKDLHRTGSTLCTGPAGDLNQAKLKRILLGYARFNPEVGYCQGFNMLGALILQVMDKDESESIRVMIYLVEGILPTGYFCGSMGGLQTDMAVFRELMHTKLPRLAKHLQKLQGPIENAYEPPLTNVFTMQWFLTMFCTCLPMSCVLRVWDLVLIEGSDVLLRTALVLWSLLEERVLSARSADDFYGKMGSFSSELLNGHLIDSNGLIEKVVQLGPISDIQKLRNKHLYNAAPIERQQGLQFYFNDDEPDIDEDSRLAVATVWGIPWGRRGSQGQQNNSVARQSIENKDRIALDISLLKKQYDRLRERQKQAQTILTTACSTASRQNATAAPLPVNQFLSGRPAIVTKKGQRSSSQISAIPPARKPSLPAILHDKHTEIQMRRGETLHWRDMKDTRNRRDSLSWKEIKAERAAMITSGSIDGLKSKKIRSCRPGKSDSSSYSEESDDNEGKIGENVSSTDTSFCDEDIEPIANLKKHHKDPVKSKKNSFQKRDQSVNHKDIGQRKRPKSWAPTNTEIPFVLMATDSPNNSADESPDNNILNKKDNISFEKAQRNPNQIENLKWNVKIFPPLPDAMLKMKEMPFDKFASTTTSIENISIFCKEISLKDSNRIDDNTNTFDTFDIDSEGEGDGDGDGEGVTNEYFERVNSTERPTKLDLLYSLNEDENVREVFQIDNNEFVQQKRDSEFSAQNDSDKSLSNLNNVKCMDLLVDYSEKSSVACIEEAKTEISTTFQSVNDSLQLPLKKEYSGLANESAFKIPKGVAEKRRDPRRLTLTRSSTIDVEKKCEMQEKRLSMDVCSNFKSFSDEIKFAVDSNKTLNPSFDMKFNKIENVFNDHMLEYEKKSAGSIISLEKRIPSTADLEERFENIQKQLIRDRNNMIKSPCDSESSEKRPNLNTSSDNNSNTNSQNEQIKKQAKNPNNIKDNEQTEDEKMLNAQSDCEEQPSASVEFKDMNESSSNKNTQSAAIVHVSKNTQIIPTTQIIPLQSKKEPPDDNTHSSISEKDGSTKGSYAETETNINTINAYDSEGHKDGFKKNMPKPNDEIVDEKETIEENRNEERKPVFPPSTEELEKRFSALEEQMSSSRNKSNEQQHDDKTEKGSDKTNEKKVNIKKSDSDSLNTNGKGTSTMLANTSAKPITDLTKLEQVIEKNTKRRLSEPPSTEDLEKRYEVLKRRMSSRNFQSRTLQKDDVSPKTNLEEGSQKLQSQNVSKSVNIKKSPPSTENLEQRFEKLQNTTESNSAIIAPKSSPSTSSSKEKIQDSFENQNVQPEAMKPNKNQAENENIKIVDPIKNKRKDESTSLDNKTTAREKANEVSEKTGQFENVMTKNINKIKIKLIEELQAKINEHSISTDIDRSVEKKNAVIEELKTKISGKNSLPDKFLKPTQISSRRQKSPSHINLLPSLSFNDETLESHATFAYRISGKHEPSNYAKRNMVRRFSDLPSRADLENRLQFLEDQLNKTVCMQRRSGDSEVASKARFKYKKAPPNVPLSDNLENHVQELEKHLNNNRTFLMDVECSNANEKFSQPDIEISQKGLAAKTIATTGKELVRYSSHGEIGDIEHQNPINISINIQMTLNKDDIESTKSTNLSKADDLDRRLQVLEQKLKTSQMPDNFEIIADTKKSTSEKINLITAENIDRNEKNICKIEKKDNVTNLDKTEHNNKQETNQSNNNDNDNKDSDNSSLITKTSEDIQYKNNNTKELKESEIDLLAEKCSNEIDNSIQNIETNQKISDTDINPEDENSKKTLLIKEDKEAKNNTIEKLNKNLKTETVGQNENNCSITNTSMESTQNNFEENKIDANSLQHFQQREQQQQQQPQQQEQQPQQQEQQQQIQDTNNKIIELKTCKLNEKETLRKSDNCEIKLNSQIVPIEVNKKTLVLLLDNEPKAVKVRRLTRANTEELEDLFQALEKQLNDRGLQKNCATTLKTASDEILKNEDVASQAMSDLAKEIETFSKSESNKAQQNAKLEEEKPKKKEEEEFDWGIDPIKYHLKKRTVYLPSTKELEARFRSLERQIKLLEDVEKIDVEQRLIEIERKIKLQYSLSHEKDLNKFLELCEGRDPNGMTVSLENQQDQKHNCNEMHIDQKCTHKHSSPPNRLKDSVLSSSVLDYNYRSNDLKRSKSKENLKKQPIHPLEMLLDPSPDDNNIPTTGELEHRIRVMEEYRCTPSPSSHKSRSQSPPSKQNRTKAKTQTFEKFTASSTERELPTAEELEARLEALEKEQCFNFKMQKNFQQFNKKLKDVISPSLSLEEVKSLPKCCDSGNTKEHSCLAPKGNKSAITMSPKTIRFCEEKQSLSEINIDSKRTIPDDKGSLQAPTVNEGLGVMGIRLMRETSPLRRKGTHTGVPLHTGENINDQLTAIQNTIKSIDSLCEEKPYRKERCQQYIDALFADSTHFGHKKTSLEDLTSHSLSRPVSRDMGPYIRISDYGPAFSRSMGSSDSIQSSSPLRPSSPLQFRSNRDLRREPSPRRRLNEDQEEQESRVRRDNLLPININYSPSLLSHDSHSSLTKFHKVDSQLIPNDVEHEPEPEEILRHPIFGPIDNSIYHDNTNTSMNVNTTPQPISNSEVTATEGFKNQNMNIPILPVYQKNPLSSSTPVYAPAKLEIRHTTVTSTFYDRVLTEKQLEKQHHSISTNNQSPMVSPLFERPIKPTYY